MAYRRHDDRMYWKTDLVRGANAHTFEEIGEGWGRDATSIFRYQRRWKQADRGSFRLLNLLFARDERHAYGAYTGEIPDADAATFEVFGSGGWEEDWGPPRFFHGGYAADARSVWHSEGTIGKPFRIGSMDRASFRWLKWGFACDRAHVFYGRYPLKHAAARTFVQLSPSFSRDDARAFFLAAEITGVDIATFAPVGGLTARDARRVYLRRAVIEGADPASYQRLGDDDLLGKDDRHVFAFGKILHGVEAASFEHLGGVWYRDERFVYHHQQPMPEIDAATFRVTAHDQGEDRASRWRNGVKLQD